MIKRQAGEFEKIAIVRNDSAEEGVKQAIEEMGGLGFIKPGQTVLVKPNVNSNDPCPGTTSPEVVFAVVKLIKARKAKVLVADRSSDSPLWGDTLANMKVTGIFQAAKQAGADHIFEFKEFVRVRPKMAKYWPKGFKLAKEIFQVDHLVSLPVIKTHREAEYTMALKNMMGCLSPDERDMVHAGHLSEKVAELSLAMKPSLIVMDGTKSFISGGPRKGVLVEPKVYIATSDLVGADIAGLSVLEKYPVKLKHHNLWEQPQIKRALQLKLNHIGSEEIRRIIKNSRTLREINFS